MVASELVGIGQPAHRVRERHGEVARNGASVADLGLVGLSVAGLLATALFIYNSGYGYDALEYLVIARTLQKGYSFYAFVPSKSWAMYYLVAAYFRLPMAATHAGVALLVLAILLLMMLATYRVIVSRGFGSRAGLAASGLVGLNAIFGELNYLEPTGLVFLFALAAFAVATRSGSDRGMRTWFAAGLWLGAATAFKAVSGLYLLAVLAWLVGRYIVRERHEPKRSLRDGAAAVTGFVAAVACQAVYFWITGRLRPYVEWSFVFPLFQYPSHVEWLSKLYTKLLWVWLVVGAALVASFDRRIRRVLYQDEKLWLLLSLGICGLVSLLKTQASHYAFLGSAFLLMCAAVVLDRWADATVSGPRRAPLAFVAALLGACVVSGVLYRPGTFARLYQIKADDDVRMVRDRVQSLVRPDGHAIFFGQGTSLYWIADRYPNWPLLNTDVQTTYYIERHSTELLRALDDPSLELVEFNPDATTFDDVRFLDRPANRAFLRMMSCRLEAGFTRRDDLIPKLVLWIPKHEGARSGTANGCDNAVHSAQLNDSDQL